MKAWIKTALKKKKWQFALVFALLGIIIALSGVLSASAGMFDDYEVNDGNDLVSYVKQKKYAGEDNKEAARYATKQWYLITYEDYWNKYHLYELDNWNRDYWKKSVFEDIGIPIDFPSITSTPVDEDGIYYQTRKADAETLVGAVLEKYSTEEGRGKLFNEDGITVYFAPVIQCTYYKDDGVGIRSQKLVYSYDEFVGFHEYVTWTDGALGAVEEMYSTSIVLNFSHIGFSIGVEDENGNLPEGYQYRYDDNSAKNQEGVPLGGQVLFGESIAGVKYPGKITGYEYAGYEFRTGDGTVIKDGSGTTTGKYTVLKEKVGDSEELVLVFKYAKTEPTPLPFATATPKPEESPTPIPTLGPTSTPAPTPQPSTNDNVVERYEYYFTTDMGYTMDEIADSSEYFVSTYNKSKAETLKKSDYTKRTRVFRVGTDADGNIWYFLPDDAGTGATYVHPAVYNGYDACTEEVRYITELIFPSTITYGSKEYTVLSIGGGSATYHKEEADEDEYYNEGTKTLTSWVEDWNYGIVSGSYYYDYSYVNTDGDTGTDKYRTTDIQYRYGVLGTGKITSCGWQNETYNTTGGYEEKTYYRNYYVYNTTLISITIPNTVTTILPYAFEYCQALVEVKGGENVANVRDYSFAGASSVSLYYSDSYTEIDWDGSKSTRIDYYYYNESCARCYYEYADGSIKYSATSEDDFYRVRQEDWTPVMLAWKEAVQLPEYFPFPNFIRLKILGSYSFSYRSNLHYVVLADTVTNVYDNAFYRCYLDGIKIPSRSTKIDYSRNEYRETLGTKGNVAHKTIIYADQNSIAATYGLTFWEYYQLDFGFPVIYHNNLTPEETYETNSQMKPVLKNVNAVAYYLTESDALSSFVYLDADGTLWHYNGTAAETEQLLPEKTFSGILYNSDTTVKSVRISGVTKYYYSRLYAVTTDGEIYQLNRTGYNANSYDLAVSQLLPDTQAYKTYTNYAETPKKYLMTVWTGVTYSAILYENMFVPPSRCYFTGWNTEPDGTGTKYAEKQTISVSGVLHLYAQWKKFSNIIRYHANGGSGSMADTVVDAEIHTAKLTPNTFFRTGYKFTGWNTEPDGSGTSYNEEGTVDNFTGTLNLYAQWEEVIIYYTVVYMMYPFGSAENEVWKSVNLAYNQTGTAEGAPYTPSGYIVSYDTNKTTSMSTTPEPLVLTEKNTKTDAPEFDRWRMYKRGSSGTLNYQGRAFTEGQTLYRLSKTDGDILYLYPAWGGADSSVLLPSAECEGYSLVGWSESKDGSGTIYYVGEDVEDGGTYTPATDTTLYAVWKSENDALQQEKWLKFEVINTDDLDALRSLEQGNQALTIKKGYRFWYRISIDGDWFGEVEEIQIIPSYYWTSEDGRERMEAVLYRGVTSNELAKCEEEKWEGGFFLSAKTWCIAQNIVPKEEFEASLKTQTLSGREEFFKKDGKLIICFCIRLRNVDGEWYDFTEWEQTELAEDALAAGWNYIPGDVVRYDLSKSIADDYEVGGVE